MRAETRFSICVLAALLCSAGLAAAQPAPWGRGGSNAEDLVIRLVTIEPGQEIYAWWGHSAIVVEDVRLKTARFYNYGLFSFQQDNFLLNFAMGRLWFQVGAARAGPELDLYRWQNRTIRIQTLDLPPQRRLAMASFLEWNILPENRSYLYDHYADNCATRVRDLIDRAVDGQLAAATAAPGPLTLRQQTRRFTAGHPVMEWVLMFLMSGVIDRPISGWQEMFLPTELEKHVAALVYRDELGRERPLVAASEVYYRAHGRPPIPAVPPAGWPWWLLLGLAVGACAAGLGWWAGKGRVAGRILYGSWTALLGLLSGLLGLVLFFMSTFTDHAVTYGNQNLLLANPLTLLALPAGIAVAAGARWAGRWAPRLLYLLVALAAVSVALKAFPALHQDNGQAMAALLPGLLGMAGGAFLWRRPLRVRSLRVRSRARQG